MNKILFQVTTMHFGIPNNRLVKSALIVIVIMYIFVILMVMMRIFREGKQMYKWIVWI